MPVLERFSFWVGIITATIFWWLLGRLKPILRWVYKQTLQILQSVRQRANRSFEEKYKADLLRYAQGLHLAAPLFALDEILVTPRVLSQPPLMEPTTENKVLPMVRQAIPYIPNCPEFHAIFNTPTLSLEEALSGQANLLLLSNPGYGKTVALAHLTSQIVRHEKSIGEFSNFLPIFIHGAELNFTSSGVQDLLELLVTCICRNVSSLTPKRLLNLIKTKIKENQVIILLDGLDEMSSESIQEIVIFLRNLLNTYPNLRIVVASSPDYHDGLLALGLMPVFMAAWDSQQRIDFIENWDRKWKDVISPILSTVSPPVDSRLLINWILDRTINTFNTPLEETLNLWAVYCGDNLGPNSCNAIEAYIRRILPNDEKMRQKLGKLAIQMLLETPETISFEDILNDDVEKKLSSVPSTIDEQDRKTLEVNLDSGTPKITGRIPKSTSGKTTSEKPKTAGLRSDLLVERAKKRVSFIHPIIAGYLAGQEAARNLSLADVLTAQGYPGTNLLSSFFLAHSPPSSSQISEYFSNVYGKQNSPIMQSLVNSVQWLRLSPKTAVWRPIIMRQLADVIQDITLALPLRTKLFWALVNSGDPGVIVLCRHLLKYSEPEIRYLGALGCGLLNDSKSITYLQSLLSDHNTNVSLAACLALSIMNNNENLETITTVLLTGGENLRQIAAEILADRPGEGHNLLIEASTYDDLMVRRAAVFGLKKVAKPWAIDILKKLETEDSQWVVRNAAEHALYDLSQLKVEVPLPIPTLRDTPWLISFAGKFGVGIPTEEAAQDMLFSVLKNGEEEQILCALRRIINLPKVSEGMISAIYQWLYGSDRELRDEAYDTLWYLDARGEKLPSPSQYGLECFLTLKVIPPGGKINFENEPTWTLESSANRSRRQGDEKGGRLRTDTKSISY